VRQTRYFIILERGHDRIRVDFETDHGEVVALHVIQYETRVAGEWQPVARYDMAHGFFHLDLYTARGAVKYRVLVSDLNQALTLAIDDLKTIWGSYERRFRGDV
jgi:hypothetical protein